MSKNPILPNTWGIPDDQARKICKALRQETRPSPMVKLMNSLKQVAAEIADNEVEPKDWADLIVYLFEQLQVESEKDCKSMNNEAMLIALSDSMNTLIDKGKWIMIGEYYI